MLGYDHLYAGVMFKTRSAEECLVTVLFMLNYFKVEFALLDVYREIMTIPFLIAQFVFLIISINYILKNQKNSLTILSVVALAISSFITIGSFF